MESAGIEKLTIVGTGLLGGSIGLALRHARFPGRIVGVGRQAATVDAARRRGCIDHGTTDLAAGVADAHMVILATPVSAILRLLEQLPPLLPPHAVVTDVGSTKRSIVATAERVLSHPERFLGSHPMAGGADAGPDAADARLFAGKPVIVTPTDRTAPDTRQRIEAFWGGLGMRVHPMPPEAHDLAVARISHMPHAAAVMLVALAGQDDLAVASTGFAGATRIAAGSPDLWADIFLDNADAIERVLQEWGDLWRRFEQIVARRDRPALLQLLKTVQHTRLDWQNDRHSNDQNNH